jgi:hypothetical protein
MSHIHLPKGIFAQKAKFFAAVSKGDVGEAERMLPPPPPPEGASNLLLVLHHAVLESAQTWSGAACLLSIEIEGPGLWRSRTPNARSLSHSPSSPPPSFTQSPFPRRSQVRDGQTSPHKPRLVSFVEVSHLSTCPPPPSPHTNSLSPSPHTNSFVIGTVVFVVSARTNKRHHHH